MTARRIVERVVFTCRNGHEQPGGARCNRCGAKLRPTTVRETYEIGWTGVAPDHHTIAAALGQIHPFEYVSRDSDDGQHLQATRERIREAIIRITTNNNFDFSNSNFPNSNNAFGSNDFDQSITLPGVGDQAALAQTLEQVGISGLDIDTLRTAIAVDGDPVDLDAPDSRVGSWLREIGGKAAAASATAATAAVLAYYGLPISRRQ